MVMINQTGDSQSMNHGKGETIDFDAVLGFETGNTTAPH
jgi:hypothetical protein